MLIQRLHPQDDALVALRSLEKGQVVGVDGLTWTVRQRIEAKHKFAARDLKPGDPVIMYGVVVGRATRDINTGEWLSQRNMTHATEQPSIAERTLAWDPPDVQQWRRRTFEGYRRGSGRCGTANYWLVVPLVFCENRNVGVMREALTKGLGYEVTTPYTEFVRSLAAAYPSDRASIHVLPSLSGSRAFPHVDGVKFLCHSMGCGGTRDDAHALCGLLAGYIAHPNVAGATILSLGCENAQVSMLREELDARSGGEGKSLFFFEQQKSSSERDLIEQALRTTFDGLEQANELRRESCSIGELVLGLKCGGSDGFSGLSANPALGHCSDLLAAAGGSAVLCEFPELCGAEQALCDRCTDPGLAKRFLDLMQRYNDWAKAIGSGFDANPSPGNIRDGLITDAMKSLGAARKSGSSPVVDVIDYPGVATKKGGVTLLCSPGNDVEATTALAGSGCNIIVFTTGLGTPTGNPICPVIKMSTNTELATRMSDLIDFDAGPIIRGEATISQIGASLLDYVVEVASGRATPAASRLGQDDFMPWKRGVSL